MADYLDPAAYARFKKGHETTFEGERAWWRNINDVPAHNQARIREVIADDCAAFGRLGYDVQMNHTGGGNHAEMYVKHPEGRQVTHSDVALLEGAVDATVTRAGWGGSS